MEYLVSYKTHKAYEQNKTMKFKDLLEMMKHKLGALVWNDLSTARRMQQIRVA